MSDTPANSGSGYLKPNPPPVLRPGDRDYCPRSPLEARGYHTIFANGNMTGNCVYCGAGVA